MSEKSKRELELIIQRLNSQLESKNAQIAELNEFIKTATENTQELIRKFRAFCVKVLESELAYGEISSRALETMSLSELLSRAQNMLQQNQEKARSIFDTFKISLKRKEERIVGLEDQISQIKTEFNDVLSRYEISFENPEDLKRIAAILLDTDAEVEKLRPPISSTTIADENERVVSFPEESTGDGLSAVEGKLYVQDLGLIIEEMKPIHWEVLRFIVESGVSELSRAKLDVNSQVRDENGDPLSPEKAFRIIKFLVTQKLFTQIKISTGIRWFTVLNLTEVGRKLYVSKYNKKPVETEYQRIIREHGNATHGYTIKDAAQILEDTGKYRSISTSRKGNAVKTLDGRTCIPDIVCCHQHGVEYYEVECGHHHQSDFNDKCDKLKKITPNLFFIGPNRETVEKKLKVQIEDWIKTVGRSQLAMSGVVVYLTSISDLAAQRWTYVYNMQGDKPIYTSASADKKP